MKREELEERKAALIKENGRIQRELVELDHLMRLAGFTQGLETVKATAEELVRLQEENIPPEDLAA